MHAQRFPCIQMDLVHQCSQFQVSRAAKNGRTCCIISAQNCTGTQRNTAKKHRDCCQCFSISHKMSEIVHDYFSVHSGHLGGSPEAIF
ncbi:unnamed protein product [Staurois parvus]|uniref:Uncharacterized protein n=1 Tax=Staurois parvus TaxID=386267 RepID=A0ABN9GMP0_9NEOB|nr:unnamed protein product [Staurois parvus]